MVFHWSLSDCKSLQVSRTPLSILSNQNNAVVWMISNCPLISKSPSPRINPLVTTKYANYNLYHRHFHVPLFFQFSCKVLVLISLFAFFQFYSLLRQNGKVHYLAGSLFMQTITRSGHLAELRRSVHISKFLRILCFSYSGMDSVLCIYHFFV